MAAALRRLKLQLTSQPEGGVAKPIVKTPAQAPDRVSLKDLKLETGQITTEVKLNNQEFNYSYVAADLKKIAAISISAIGVEIALSLTLGTGFAKLILRNFGIEI